MLRLTEAQRQFLFSHGCREIPRECCGIFLGHRTGSEASVEEVLPCLNAAEHPETRYTIAAVDLLAAQRRARSLGLSIIGFYHSHPQHPAIPSATDKREAYWTGCSYAIVSLLQNEIRSYVLLPDGSLAEEPIA
jgi:proteasome lid subunit RPN8/RPN11